MRSLLNVQYKDLVPVGMVFSTSICYPDVRLHRFKPQSGKKLFYQYRNTKISLVQVTLMSGFRYSASVNFEICNVFFLVLPYPLG